MSEYPGYPRFVIVAMPKSGTKTMNSAMTALGFKVFDIMQATDHAKKVRSKISEKGFCLLPVMKLDFVNFFVNLQSSRQRLFKNNFMYRCYTVDSVITIELSIFRYRTQAQFLEEIYQDLNELLI